MTQTLRIFSLFSVVALTGAGLFATSDSVSAKTEAASARPCVCTHCECLDCSQTKCTCASGVCTDAECGTSASIALPIAIAMGGTSASAACDCSRCDCKGCDGPVCTCANCQCDCGCAG